MKSKTTWYCDICGHEYASKEAAEKCEYDHYKFVQVADISYVEGKKCPQYIVCDIDIGGDVKSVTFVAAQEGWGGN